MVRGYDSGGLDGLLGTRTQSSLRAFQTAGGLRVTGYLDLETLDALGVTTAEPSLGAGPSPATTGTAAIPIAGAAVSLPPEPEWLDRPTSADLERFRPSAAAGRAGVSTVRCRVQDDGTLADCTPITESPSGSRYGQAAVRASALYRMRVDGAYAAFIGREIEVPITWQAR